MTTGLAGDTEMDDSVAPPRRNGELIFEAPWESRIYAMAMLLHERGLFPWRDFSAGLAREIAGAQGQADGPIFPLAPDTDQRCYRHWLHALEHVLMEADLLGGDEIEARTNEYAQGLYEEH